MAVTGTFQADFSSFYDAVQKAEVHLRSFESGSAAVGKQLDRMADNFSGRRVIAEATLMADAIEKTGGASKLTAAELARVGAVAGEAAEKMKKLGQDVPKNLQDLAGAAKDANAPVGTLTSTYQKFDGVLQSAGINIGPYVKGLSDISSAAGKSVTEIGALSAAGLAFGAAAAGWGIGRLAAEWFDLDRRIAGASEKMLKAQEHGARMDVLARASENAGRRITDYSEAIRINNEYTEAAATGIVDWEGKINAAGAQLDAFSKSELEQIALADKLGATEAQLKLQYGLTTDAVTLVTERLKNLNEEDKKSEAAAKKHADALSELAFAGEGWKGTLEDMDDKLVVSITNYLKAGVSQGALAESFGLTAQQVKAVALALDEEKEAAKHAESALAQVAKLSAENAALEIAMSGTARDVKIANINAEFEAARVALLRRKELTIAAETELARQRDLKIQKELADYALLNQTSRSSLEQLAEFERRTYEEMAARSSEFAAEAVQAQREKWLSAQDDVRNWREVQAGAFKDAERDVKQYGSVFESAFDRMSESVSQTTARIKEMKAVESFSMDVQPLKGFELENLKARFHRAGDTDDSESLERALAALESKEGKYGSIDSNREFFAMQKEQVLLAQLRMMMPGQSTSGGGGGVNIAINGSVLGNKEEIARVVGAAVMDAMRSQGFRAPVGA